MAACPKCGTDREEALASCRKCGLAYDKWVAFQASRGVNLDALDAAWKHALDHWDDPKAHDELLRLVTQHDAWAWVAGRYRERGDAAKDHLDRVKRMAEVTMMQGAAAKAAAKTPEPYRATMAVMAVLMIIVIVGLFYATFHHRAPKAGDIKPPSAPLHAK